MREYTEPKSRFDVVKSFVDSIWGEQNLWDDAHFILVDVPLDKKETERILPAGLKLTDPPTATLFISDYLKTSFTVPYKEAALLAHVKSIVGKGVHCPWMIVDDDTALIYGRELLGYPKKMGDFEFEETEQGVRASISRRGVKVLELKGKRGREEEDPGPVLQMKTFNAGGPGQMFLMNPLWLFHPNEVIHKSYEADVEVTVRESEYDPIGKLIAGGAIPGTGRIAVIDIIDGKYHVPVGLAGLMHMGRTFLMRFR